MWVEKYRPRKLSDMVLIDEHRSAIEGMIADNAIPHLLLVGNVGSGKTTIARILVESIDCTCLELNASDERGIDTVRVKVKEYLQTAGFRKWRICFLDEADALTPDAMFCLRNIMEQYSQRGRFILTANYESKILDAIRSRCQILRFESLDRKSVFKHARKILDSEKVQYDVSELISTVDDNYPDIRGVINALQLSTVNGKLYYSGIADLVAQVRGLIKTKNLNDVRSFVMTHRPDFTMLYRGLFDTIDKLVSDNKRTEVSLSIAEYMYRDSVVADREINFAACVLEIMRAV